MFRDPAGKFLLVDASGKLDLSKYQERVGDIPTFERGIAQDIAREKLEALITAGVTCLRRRGQRRLQEKEHVARSYYVSVSTSEVGGEDYAN
jgi:hypothetical protein